MSWRPPAEMGPRRKLAVGALVRVTFLGRGGQPILSSILAAEEATDGPCSCDR